MVRLRSTWKGCRAPLTTLRLHACGVLRSSDRLMLALSDDPFGHRPKGEESKWWTRAESNRRPGVTERPLSYARSRRFISAPKLPSTGSRKPIQHVPSRRYTQLAWCFGISHTLASVLNPRFRGSGQDSGDVAAVMPPERMPAWHLCFGARFLTWPTSIHGALQTVSASRSKPVRAPLFRELL